MTYDPNTPNASQSPGVFPVGNNTNFTRLKQIISGDHQFNDTQNINTDGKHLQVTLINRAVPSSVPAGTIGMVYARSISGTPQLFWYNGTTVQQLSDPTRIYPIRVVGTITLAASTTGLAFADPGYEYNGTGTASVQSSSISKFYYLIRAGSNIRSELNSTGSPAPTFSFSGNDLMIRNTDTLNPKTLVWSLIINRIS